MVEAASTLPLGVCICPVTPRQPPEPMRAPTQYQKLFELPPRVAFDLSWGRPERGVGPVDQGHCSAAHTGIKMSCFRGRATGRRHFIAAFSTG